MLKTSLLKKSKKEIRKEILSIRLNLSHEYVDDYSRKIAKLIFRDDFYKTCNKICLYMPIKNEIDVRYIMKQAYLDKKKVYLPKICELGDDKIMYFYEYNEGDTLIRGFYNILEPSGDKILDVDDKTLVIMPGAVYSLDNKRIGYGGGFYDKFLANNPSVKKLAVAYYFQILDHIPYDEHDIEPDKIIFINQGE